MYSLQIKYTGVYDPDATDPDIVVTRDPDHPGTYIYSWTTHRTSMSSNEINGTLDEVWNGISTFTFNVYYGSPCWDVFFPARTAIRLWSEKEQKYIFNGRVADVTENMGADGLLYRTIQCENELSYLCDSICDTKEVEERLQDYNRGMNARDVLITMLELHHINAEGIAATLKKGFMPPNSTWNDETESYNYPSTCYPAPSIDESFSGDVDTTWALIQDILINSLGMDIWVTYNDEAVPVGGDPTWAFGYNVLNMWYGTATGTQGDPITISTNMKSLKIETAPTSNGRITRIVPLGGIGVNGRRLDVSSIPQYHEGWTDPSYEKAISNEFLSITYGHVDKVSLHEDLVDNGNKTEAEVNAMIQELYRRGKAEADALSGGITSISIEAVDLYEAGYDNAHKFEIGNYHRIVNDFFGLDESFRLVRKVTDLSQPWNPKLEFAKGQTSQTNLTKNRQVRTSERIYNVENMISTRLDKSAVMRTTAARYAAMTSRNPTTVHYADQGDGTWKAYMGDEPIVFSDGGWEVETATILNTSNFDDYVIDAEEMAVVSPTTKLYYGATNRFIVVQGMLCYYGAYNASSTISGASVLPPTINGSAEAFQAILDNWDHYSHCVGDMDDPSNSILMYNTNRNIRYVSLAISTQTATMNYSSGNEYITQTLKTFASSWSWTPAAYPTTLKFYNDLTPEEKATVTQVYKWGGSASAHNVYHNGSTQLTALASQYALIPIVTSISTQTTYNNYPTPYGYAECQGFFIIADGEWTGNVIDRWGQISGGSYANTNLPFKSQAELDFALGLTKRSEPSEVD